MYTTYWKNILPALKGKIGGTEDYEVLIKPLKYVSYLDKVLTLSAPDDFPEQFFQGAYADMIMQTFYSVNNLEVKEIKIASRKSKSYKKEEEKRKTSTQNKQNLPQTNLLDLAGRTDENLQTVANSTHNSFFVFQLRKDFTFKNFIEGDSNRMAVACAKRFQHFPDIDFKTLYLYGISGVGKTHLAQAIGNWFLQNNNNYKAIYVPSERFVNDYVTALKIGKIDEFRNYYRSADIFLLDDVQFFEGKDKSQEEIFHTYEFLKETGKAVVFCSDRQLSQMNMENRLLTRLSQHFVVDIKPPDELTLRAIIDMKCDAFQFSLPPHLMECLANSGISSIRMIEGIIFNLNWLAKHGKEIDLSTLKETIAKIRPSNKISPEQVIKTVANTLGLTIEEIKGRGRQKEIVLGRQMSMYIIRLVTNKTLQEISTVFNKKDHTTVLHATKKIKELLEDNQQYKTIYHDIMNQLDLSNGGI